MRISLVTMVLLGLAMPALADPAEALKVGQARREAPQPQPNKGLDPRLTNATLATLQSLIALRETELKILAEDSEKRIAELMALCGDPCKEKKDANAASPRQ